MSSPDILRIASLCVALAGVETLHGIVRTVWLVRRIGKERAIKVSVVSGTAIALGKLVMHFTWQRIFRDFNPSSGNYLSFGLATLTLIPALVWWLQNSA